MPPGPAAGLYALRAPSLPGCAAASRLGHPVTIPHAGMQGRKSVAGHDIELLARGDSDSCGRHGMCVLIAVSRRR